MNIEFSEPGLVSISTIEPGYPFKFGARVYIVLDKESADKILRKFDVIAACLQDGKIGFFEYGTKVEALKDASIDLGD